MSGQDADLISDISRMKREYMLRIKRRLKRVKKSELEKCAFNFKFNFFCWKILFYFLSF
jgi:hypothetical protein